jgi:methylthioribulose-1-phosphate dehydratase
VIVLERDEVLAVGARLAAEAERFWALGWMPATSGNLSEVLRRDPLLLAVTASGRDKGELRPDDVAVVDAAGAVVHVPGLESVRPSAEAGLHARVAVATGARSVVHLHTQHAVEAARRWPDGVVLGDLELLKALDRGAHGDTVRVPVIPNSQDMDELGDRFDDVHDAAVPAVLIAGHGSYTWGSDALQARWRTEALDWLLGSALRVA